MPITTPFPTFETFSGSGSSDSGSGTLSTSDQIAIHDQRRRQGDRELDNLLRPQTTPSTQAERDRQTGKRAAEALQRGAKENAKAGLNSLGRAARNEAFDQTMRKGLGLLSSIIERTGIKSVDQKTAGLLLIMDAATQGADGAQQAQLLKNFRDGLDVRAKDALDYPTAEDVRTSKKNRDEEKRELRRQLAHANAQKMALDAQLEQAAEQAAKQSSDQSDTIGDDDDQGSGYPCDYPDQVDSRGRRCGGRAAIIRPGGRFG